MRGFIGTIALITVSSLGCGGHNSPPPPPSVTGNWTGTATSVLVPVVVTINGDLTQGATNPDGSISFSGALTLSNCISTIAVSGKISGSTTEFFGSDDRGGFDVTATINTPHTQMNGTYNLAAGTACSQDAGSVVLTRQ